jgi:hypothetical protein
MDSLIPEYGGNLLNITGVAICNPSTTLRTGPRSAIPYHFCTYFDRNYLTRGLTLYNSLRQHCQRPFVLWILCFDGETYDILSRLDLPGVRLISQEEFEAGDEELLRAKVNRSRVEYYWTCTPSLPLYVLRYNSEVELITYLDADLYFYSDPQPIFDELGDGSILIIGHRFPPELKHLEKFGKYNVGTLVFRRGEHGLAILNHWRAQCLDWCYARWEDGKFGDQKYLDDWPDFFRGVVVLQHKGAGLAPWNYSRYEVSLSGRTQTVDGQPLIFYHFHSFRMMNAYVVEPTLHNYGISLKQALRFYVPYAHALRRTQQQVEKVSAGVALVNPPTSLREMCAGLLGQRLLLVRPFWLSRILWQIGGWNRVNRTRVEAGFVAYASGDLVNARRHFVAVARRNPFILCNRGILSILLESMLGSEMMSRYRTWRRRVLPKAQH